MLRGCRQNDAKNGAFAGFGVEFQPATVFVNNACRNGQSQAGAVILGAKKWIKYQGPDFGRDTGSGISHFEDNRLSGLAVKFATGLAGAQGDNPAAIESFGSISHQINQDLFELLRVGKELEVFFA